MAQTDSDSRSEYQTLASHKDANVDRNTLGIKEKEGHIDWHIEAQQDGNHAVAFRLTFVKNVTFVKKEKCELVALPQSN